MDLTCVGFWVVVLVNGTTLYTDDIATVLDDLRPDYQMVRASCRKWDSLPKLSKEVNPPRSSQSQSVR